MQLIHVQATQIQSRDLKSLILVIQGIDLITKPAVLYADYLQLESLHFL